MSGLGTSGHILIKIVKGVPSKNTHWVNWWVIFEFDHNLPTNHFEIKVVGTF